MRGEWFWKIGLQGIFLTLITAASAAQSERWNCKGDDPPGYVGDWVIAENRMFAVKGKGTYLIISDSSSVAMAYDFNQAGKNDPVISNVIVLDKVGRQMIQFDDILAAATHDASEQPGVRKYVCRKTG